MKVKSERDLWAGVMFVAFGLFFVLIAAGTPEFIDRIVGERLIPGYQMGSALRMGPAYFPVVLGGLLVVLGALVVLDSLAEEGPKVAQFHFRPLLFILASSLAFAYLLKPLGLIVSSIALIFISAYGGHEFKWKEVAVLSVVLAIFSVIIFVKALQLPFPIWPDPDEIQRSLGSRPTVPAEAPAPEASKAQKKKIGEK